MPVSTGSDFDSLGGWLNLYDCDRYHLWRTGLPLSSRSLKYTPWPFLFVIFPLAVVFVAIGDNIHNVIIFFRTGVHVAIGASMHTVTILLAVLVLAVVFVAMGVCMHSVAIFTLAVVVVAIGPNGCLAELQSR
jgi:hypothetical protein